MLFNVFIIPFYNHYFKTYQHVLSIDSLPPQNIQHLIYKYPHNKLSEFIPRDPNHCFYLLSRPQYSIKSLEFLLTPSDVPELIQILKQNNYQVTTDNNFDFSFSDTYKKIFVLSFT